MQDTRAGGREEDEEADVQEDSDNGTTQLSDELVARLRAQEVTGLQVASHVSRLGSGAGGDDTSSQVHDPRRVWGKTHALANTTEDQLRRLLRRCTSVPFPDYVSAQEPSGAHLGHSRDRVDICSTCALDTDEREEEAED